MATSPRTLLLLRHGETTWNAERRWQGWADTPLSPLGEQQARDAAVHLRGLGLTAIVTSDLERARRTGELIAAGLDPGIEAGVTVEPALRERNVGAFSGKTIEELLAEFPECFDAETRILQVPGGETDEDLWQRVAPTVVSLAEGTGGHERLLVVTHGGVIRTIERHLGLDPGASLPNLAGRWLGVEAGHLVPGERCLPLEAGLVTAQPTE